MEIIKVFNTTSCARISLILTSCLLGVECSPNETVTTIDSSATGGQTSALSDSDSSGSASGETTTAGSSSSTGSEASTGDNSSTSSSESTSEGKELCEPGTEVEEMYSGPQETQNIGACKAGKKVCNDEGSAWVEVEKEVLPSVEVCGNFIDENCDGSMVCAGEEEWVMQVGAQNNVLNTSSQINGLVVDSVGRPWLTGSFSGYLNLVGMNWDAGNSGDFYALRVDGKGVVDWGFASGSKNYETGTTLAIDGQGKVAVGAAIQATGKIDFGPGEDSPVHQVLSKDIIPFSAALGVLNEDGTYVRSGLWASKEKGASTEITDLAYDPMGNLYAVGTFNGTLDVGGEDDLVSLNDTDNFLVKMGPDGQVIWTQKLGDDLTSQIALRIATDLVGNLWLAGVLKGQMIFQGGQLNGGDTDEGDMMVVKLDSDGNWIWGKQYGDHQLQGFSGVEVDTEGNGVVIGEYDGSVTMGGKLLENKNVSDGSGVVAKIDGQSGMVQWVKDIPCNGLVSFDDVSIDNSGQIIVGGGLFANSAMQIEEQNIPAQGSGWSSVIVKFGSEGEKIWNPKVYNVDLSKVKAGPLGEIYVVGHFDGKKTFGMAGDLDIGVAGPDGFLLKLKP